MMGDSSEAEQRVHTPPVAGSTPAPPAKHLAYTPAKGYERNPLRAFRNIPCPCGSKKKAKRCHGATDYVAASQAKLMRDYLRELSMYGFIEARKWEIG